MGLWKLEECVVLFLKIKKILQKIDINLQICYYKNGAVSE